MKKILFVILDGLGDRPTKEFDGKTPLEAAYTPNLDELAKEGATGSILTVGRNIAPESDVAITALLGYDPYKYFTGRGAIEAYGAGISLKNKWVAFRTNFSTVSKGKLIDRRAGRSLRTTEARELEKAINENIRIDCLFVFKATSQHRGVLVFWGDFSDNVSNSDPAYEKIGTFGVAKEKFSQIELSKPLDGNPKSRKTSDLINSFVSQSNDILTNHPVNKDREKKSLLPANIILTRDASTKLPKFPPEKGKWGAVVGMSLEIGLVKLSGMEVLPFDYPEIKDVDVYKSLYDGLSETIGASKKYIEKRIKDFDAFYIHFKETDIPGHDGRPEDKKKMIEMIDREFFSFARKIDNVLIVVTADHSTPCGIKAHSADPVPLIIYGGETKDDVSSFGENACRKGIIGEILGKDLMKRITELNP